LYERKVRGSGVKGEEKGFAREIVQQRRGVRFGLPGKKPTQERSLKGGPERPESLGLRKRHQQGASGKTGEKESNLKAREGLEETNTNVAGGGRGRSFWQGGGIALLGEERGRGPTKWLRFKS